MILNNLTVKIPSLDFDAGEEWQKAMASKVIYSKYSSHRKTLNIILHASIIIYNLDKTIISNI